MRAIILAPIILAFGALPALSSSILILKDSTRSQSTITIEAKTTSFELYGPSGSNCKGDDCPSTQELEQMAKKGVNVLKISGGNVSTLDKVFPAMPSKELKVADSFKTGPLPDGAIQEDMAGVDTELLPDELPDFEPEIASSGLNSEDMRGTMPSASTQNLDMLANAL